MKARLLLAGSEVRLPPQPLSDNIAYMYESLDIGFYTYYINS